MILLSLHCYIFCREILQGELKLPEETVRVVQIFVIFLHPQCYVSRQETQCHIVPHQEEQIGTGWMSYGADSGCDKSFKKIGEVCKSTNEQLLCR